MEKSYLSDYRFSEYHCVGKMTHGVEDFAKKLCPSFPSKVKVVISIEKTDVSRVPDVSSEGIFYTKVL